MWNWHKNRTHMINKHMRACLDHFLRIHSQHIKGEQEESIQARNQLSHIQQFTKPGEGKT